MHLFHWQQAMLTVHTGASEINITCVIEERDADRALNILHTNLFTFLDYD